MDKPPPSATAKRLALVATVLAVAGVWALIEWRSAPPPPPKVQMPYPTSTPATRQLGASYTNPLPSALAGF